LVVTCHRAVETPSSDNEAPAGKVAAVCVLPAVDRYVAPAPVLDTICPVLPVDAVIVLREPATGACK